MISKFQRLVEIVMRECGGQLDLSEESPYSTYDTGLKFWSTGKSWAIFDFYISYRLRSRVKATYGSAAIFTRESYSREILELMKGLIDEDKRVRLKNFEMFSNVRDAKGGRITLKIHLIAGEGPNLRKLRRYAMIANS